MRPFARRRGIELVMVVVMISLMTMIGLAALTMVQTESIQTRRLTRIQQSFAIAEAGISYYRWHLSHFPDDFQDGTNAAGPYIHDFQDATGTTVGKYELVITPPAIGSTITTIQSTGYLLSAPSSKKILTVRMGIPSLTKYAVLGNSDLRFGAGTITYGPVHSNGGIRFDGLAWGLVTSAKITYDDPDHTGSKEWGVHTHDSPTDALPPASPTPPYSLPSRPDIFQGSRQVGIASIDFLNITTDLESMKTKAQASGIYLPSSGALGYHITLKTTGKFDIKVVNGQLNCQFRSGTGVCSNNASRSCTGVNTNCQSGGTCLNWHDYGYCSADFNRTCISDSACRRCSNSPSLFCTQDSNCRVCSGNNTIACSQNSDCSSQSAGTCPSAPVNSCAPAAAGACQNSNFSIGTAAGSETTYTYQGVPATNLDFPANGIIFASDDVWADGAIDGARIAIAAAKDPLASGTANIYINNNLTYAHTDGTDVVGLIAQQNILVGFFSQDNLTIDAAMIAQKGRVGRPYYGSGFTSSTASNNFQLSPTGSTLPNGGAGETSCHQFRKRTSLTALGSLATYARYGFAWTGTNLFACASGWNDSGYCDRDLTFDANLTYGPPPEFPTTGEYQVISFDEQ